MTVKLKQKVQLEGTEYTVTKLAGKEIRLESADGTVKYRRLATVERMLDEQKPAKQRRPRAPKTQQHPADHADSVINGAGHASVSASRNKASGTPACTSAQT